MGLDKIIQDGAGHGRLGGWFKKGNLAETTHAGEHGELEPVRHILSDFPLTNAHMNDHKSILLEVSRLLRKTELIYYLDEKDEVLIKL